MDAYHQLIIVKLKQRLAEKENGSTEKTSKIDQNEYEWVKGRISKEFEINSLTTKIQAKLSLNFVYHYIGP